MSFFSFFQTGIFGFGVFGGVLKPEDFLAYGMLFDK
jgi:hypothetical protein